MDEVDIEVFNISDEVVPLINLLLLLSPIVFVCPDLIQIGCPFCGEAVFGPCALHNVLRRDSGVFDLAIVAFDLGVGYIDLEWANLG